MKTTNRKHIAESLAKEAGFYLTKESVIKLSRVDSCYFSLSEGDILARFEHWLDCIYWLKGFLTAKRGY